jgi:hypothetical protein
MYKILLRPLEAHNVVYMQTNMCIYMHKESQEQRLNTPAVVSSGTQCSTTRNVAFIHENLREHARALTNARTEMCSQTCMYLPTHTRA